MSRFKIFLCIAGIIIIIALLLGTFVCFSIKKNNEKISFSEKIQQGDTINIVVNGDSIGGSKGNREWSSLLKEKLNEEYGSVIRVNNISKPGNSSFAGIVSWEMLDDDKKRNSDLVILCYGHNDQDDSSFKAKYEALIRNTINANPNVEIVVILESSQKRYTKKIKSIMELCDYYSIEYVDTIKAFNLSKYSYGQLTDDGIHPNAIGKEIYANAIYDVIQNKLIEKNHKTKEEEILNKKPQNLEAEKYEKCHYISKEKMKIKGNSILTQIPEGTMVGIDAIFVNGEHDIQCYISGKKYNIGYSWNYDDPQRHIYLISENKYDAGELRIVFENADMIKNFMGFVYFN